MGRKKYTKVQVAEIVESEGLAYAVMHYMHGKEIANAELAEAWDAADAALRRVLELLPELEED